MSLDLNQQKQIMNLLLLSLEGDATQEDMQKLKDILDTSWQARDYYLKAVIAAECIREMDWQAKDFTNPADECDGFNTMMWKALAEEEKSAPVIEIVVPEEFKEQGQEVVQTVSVRKISRVPVITAIAACAALLVVFLYVYLNPQMTEVATLTDSINPVWGNPESSVQVGSRLLTTTKPVALKQGIIKILYDDDIEVLIEAPAEYQILSSKEIALRSGRLFAKVSLAGRGFAVKTNNTKIVDLGTEFGVYSDLQDKTELHVFKGKTVLSSTKDKSRINLGVISGQAREVGVAGDIKDIQINKEGFVRAIESKTNLVWRGQKLDLADMAGMGNGLGTGKSSVIIHPTKGYTKDSESGFIRPRDFLPIADNPFVDGIFVPHNENTELIVSTRGDIFKGAPKTSGLHSIDLVANPEPGFFASNSRKGTIEFDGQPYGAGGKPCINMHANIGLTFDLDAIRKHYQCGINRFTSRIGIADLNENVACNADFYVLVDGQIRDSLRQYKQKGVLNGVSVEIKDTDRFLTLVTTDGGDPDYPEGGFYKRSNSCDWCVFTEPVLILE